MPIAGPTVGEIVDTGAERNNVYVVIDLNPEVLRQLALLPSVSLAQTFGSLPPPKPQALETGDTVSVAIWEAGGGGLFSPADTATPAGPAPATGAHSIVVPNQAVDLDGEITVPFAGQLKIAGMSPPQAGHLVEERLARIAIQPQALVTMMATVDNTATVSGDVNAPGRLPLALSGTRVLDAIAQAGGPKWPAYDSAVQLTRGPVTRRVRLEQVVETPSENVFLQAGDLLHVVRAPQSVAVLGATSSNALVPFDTERLTLAEALGKAGGLNDQRSNPEGVFVFRMEPASLVRALEPARAGAPLPEQIPVVFRANLRQPEAYFLSQSFEMSDKDVVYAANTESVQFSKLLNIFQNSASLGLLATH
jgi:polysaccharide export outer membrane protein